MSIVKHKAVALAASFTLTVSLFGMMPGASAAESLPGPSSLEVIQTNNSPRLTWDEVPGATGYRVELSPVADFSNGVEAVNTSARTYAPRKFLDSSTNRTVYWRVAAFTDIYLSQGSLTPWTEGTPITYNAVAGPTGLSPANDATFSYPAPVKFSWDSVPGAQSYNVEYVVGGDFSSSSTVRKNTSGTTLIPNNILASGTWTWRVQAKLRGPDNNTFSSWTTPQTFKVDWKNADSTVQQISPVNFSDNTAAIIDPVFKWSPVEGASYYKITVARDSAMTNTFFPPATVYGTSYVPTGPLLDGAYYWTVTAYDAAGNAGFTPSSPWQFHRRWGPESSAVQNVNSGPTGINVKPVPAPGTGSDTFANASSLPWNKFEFKWNAVARATMYEVQVNTLTDPNPKVYTCRTPNTSVSMGNFYAPGEQSPDLYKGAGACFEYLPQYYVEYDSQGQPQLKRIVYRWSVKAIDYSGSGEMYGQGERISESSDARYFQFTCENGDVCGGNSTTNITLDPNATWETQGGDLDLTNAPAPVMEWEPYPGTCDNNLAPTPRQYEVRIYRSSGTTVHVATFRTYSTKFRANGTFKDDNTAQSYYWRVRPLCNGAYLGSNDWGTVDSRSWTRTTTPTTVPAAYQESHNGVVLLKWTPQFDTAVKDGGTQGYRVEYRSASSSGAGTPVDVEYPFWIPNMGGNPLPSDTYEFRVAPLDAFRNVGRFSGWKTFITAPSVPTGVNVTPVGSSSLAVSWNPSAVAEGYQLRYQLNGSSAWITGDYTQQTSGVVTGLEPGTYNVQVRSLHAGNNWSNLTASVQGTVASKTVSIITPNNAVLDVDNRMLQWSPVAGASRYWVQFGNSPSEVNNAAPVEVVRPLYTPVEDVRYSRAYYYKITALAESPFDVKLGSSTTQTVYFTTTPFEPTISRVDRIGTDLRINWIAPATAEAGDNTTLTYQLRYRKANQVPQADWINTAETSGAATSATVTGLEINSTYEFQVRAFNDNGGGRWSGLVTASTASTPLAPGNLTVNAVAEKTADLSWYINNDGGSPITGHTVRWQAVGDTEWKEAKLPADATRYQVTGLVKKTEYVFEVTASNVAGESPASVVTAVTRALPTAVRNLKYTSGNSVVGLKWNAPADQGESKITGYIVEVRYMNGSAMTGWTTVSEPTTTSVNIPVGNGVKHEFRVAARNTQGVGGYSNVVSLVTGTPGAPKAKLVNVKKKLKASWSKPADSGFPLTHYKIQYSLDAKKWSNLKTLSAKKRSLVFVKGKRKKNIYVRVAAKNANGYGAYGKVAKTKRR